MCMEYRAEKKNEHKPNKKNKGKRNEQVKLTRRVVEWYMNVMYL